MRSTPAAIGIFVVASDSGRPLTYGGSDRSIRIHLVSRSGTGVITRTRFKWSIAHPVSGFMWHHSARAKKRHKNGTYPYELGAMLLARSSLLGGNELRRFSRCALSPAAKKGNAIDGIMGRSCSQWCYKEKKGGGVSCNACPAAKTSKKQQRHTRTPRSSRDRSTHL